MEWFLLKDLEGNFGLIFSVLEKLNYLSNYEGSETVILPLKNIDFLMESDMKEKCDKLHFSFSYSERRDIDHNNEGFPTFRHYFHQYSKYK